MIDASQVTACLVTRGDQDLSEIIDSQPFENIVVYDNSAQPDLAVYGRYEAVARADHQVCMVQDDDCVLAPETFDALLAAYKPGHVACNMPQRFRDTGFYDDHALVGFGAIFDCDLPRAAFKRFIAANWPGIGPSLNSRWVLNTCDIVFTTLTPRILVDLPYTDLPWASAPNRMWKQKDHVGERTRMLDLARKVRDA